MIAGDLEEDLRVRLREEGGFWAGASWDDEEDAVEAGEKWEPVESERNSECEEEEEVDIVIPEC